MVAIADINKDLDKYLSSRREKSGFSFLKREPKPERQPLPQDLKNDEVRVFEKEPGFLDRLFGKEERSEDLTPEEMARLESMEVELARVEKAERAHPEMEPELEEVREGLLERFFSLFRGYERQHRTEERAQRAQYIEEEVIPRMDEDVKRVLKIVHKWLAKLPKRQRDEFRKSRDFAEYKRLLEKYGVAKKEAAPPPAIETGDEYPVLGAK